MLLLANIAMLFRRLLLPQPLRFMTEIIVPSVGESVSEVQIGQWLKKEGDWVAGGTDLVDLETEKASVQISAPEDGILVKILRQSEEFATVGDVIATFQPSPKGRTDVGSIAKRSKRKFDTDTDTSADHCVRCASSKCRRRARSRDAGCKSHA